MFAPFKLLISLTLAGIAWQACAKPIISTSTNQSTTNLRMIMPYNEQGVNPKLKIIKEANGTCWASSRVNGGRPNTWRCQAENVVYDPCFTNPVRTQNSVVCFENPWSRNAILLHLQSPLPVTKNTTFNITDAEPWALELENGKMCTMTTEPTISIAGMDTHYLCKAGDVVVGKIDRRTNTWQVFFLGNEDLHMSQTRVTAAWY